MARKTPAVYDLVEITFTDVTLEGGKLKKEETFTYQNKDGVRVQFHAHPTKNWNWVITEGEKKNAHRVINAFIVAGFNQHRFPGGFEEAIKSITLRL